MRDPHYGRMCLSQLKPSDFYNNFHFTIHIAHLVLRERNCPFTKCNSQQTQNICITFVQCCTYVEDVWANIVQMLYKCFVFSGFTPFFTYGAICQML